MATLSVELQNRVKREIIHVDNLLKKEMRFSEDLRDNEMVDFYNRHLTKLKNML